MGLLMQASCPICGLGGGFHDSDEKESKHREHEVPRELLKEPGWAKEAYAELRRERAAQIAVFAAEIDDDKQAWFMILGQLTLVLGTRPTEHENVTIDEEGTGEVSLDLPLPESSGATEPGSPR
jgi:hypothetical protein